MSTGQLTTDIIRSWPAVNGWHVSPGHFQCRKGYHVHLGDYVRLGNYVHLGDGVRLGNYVTLGDHVTLGNYVHLGDGVRLGDDVTLGNYVRLGNRVRLGDHVTLGDGVTQAQHLGYEPRGYALVVALQDGQVRFGAGCRWFTLAEARKHWGGHYTGSGDPWIFQAALEYAEAVAATWED